jgi:2-iminobutanoate/2-iminopropanoate deaminase
MRQVPEVIVATDAPRAIGPYSHAIRAGDLVFTSGQIALNPATGELSGDVASQTEQVLRNLDAVLRAAGTSLDRIVKTTIFVTDMGSFKLVNSIYEKFLGTAKPARSTVEVRNLPMGALIEIEAVALG